MKNTRQAQPPLPARPVGGTARARATSVRLLSLGALLAGCGGGALPSADGLQLPDHGLAGLEASGEGAARDTGAGEPLREAGVDGTASGDASARDAKVKDAKASADADALAALAKPFGTWTSQCTATPYPSSAANAYPTGFQQVVADDWVYVAWVWRLSPDAATNHSVSAMKSKDLKTWYNLCGVPLTLPITPASPTVIDPVPIQAGLLNSRLALSFDAAKRAVITYQKHIAKTFPGGSVKKTTQVFNARWEGSALKIYQLTSWDSLDSFGGGGSLPSTATTISFSGLRVSAAGTLAQTVTRSTADDTQCKPVEGAGGVCTAFPRSGTWEVQDSASGLALRSPLTAVSASSLASTDPWENPATPALSVGSLENKPLSSDPKAAAWQVRAQMSRAETRWITLRSDFDGDGANNRGLFDRYNSLFFAEASGALKVFQFGTRAGMFWPLTGDWNKDGVVTVGVHQATTGTTFLKNTLAPGAADVTLTGPLSSVSGVVDSPLVWHPVNPAARYAIKWESLPVNRDYAYDCSGVPLQTASGGCLDGALISSNLYLVAFDAATGTWKKSLIDRAWGGTTVGFDFLTFKNVQLVLYYGQDRYARLAQRVRLSGGWSAWTITTLPTQLAGWDSHNYLTLTIDRNHHVHVAGNMHASPLVYFRGTGFFGGTAPLSYTKLSMTGLNESATTYPTFLRGPTGELLFSYRSGSSGSGDTYLHRYDEDKGTWAPLHGAATAPVPLFKGL